MPSNFRPLSGDVAAAQQRFLALFLRSEGEIFRYVMALIPSVIEAEEIVQQTAISGLRHSKLALVAVHDECARSQSKNWRYRMNSWASIQPGRRLPTCNGGSFAIYRAGFTPRLGIQKSGGTINFPTVTGKAQVWLDGKLAGEKTTAGRNNLTIPFPPGDGERTISVLIETSSPGTPAELGGTVTVE